MLLLQYISLSILFATALASGRTGLLSNGCRGWANLTSHLHPVSRPRKPWALRPYRLYHFRTRCSGLFFRIFIWKYRIYFPARISQSWLRCCGFIHFFPLKGQTLKTGNDHFLPCPCQLTINTIMSQALSRPGSYSEAFRVQMSARRPAILNEIYRYFTQYLRENAGTITQIAS